jgi:translocation protein SEC66
MVSVSASTIAFGYLALVLGSLTVFSTIYRRRKALQLSSIEPWFPDHPNRDIYLTLLHQEPACPPQLLKAALLERAREDISQVYILRESKAAGSQLLQKGSISEVTFQRIVAAESELNAEIADVMAEAKALGGEEWGSSILPQANESYQKRIVLEAIERSKALAEFERRRWDEEETFRKELRDKQREIALKELAGEEGVKEVGMNGDFKAAVEGEIPNGDNNGNLMQRKSKKKNRK